ncbi:MAG: GNAT family N-acetyltransferase [Candidatus Dormibacteraeota bacterium]|uniref:GNAT family N-acetyltransferase n=1 Tax=Candidatus Amunia macphersoniae TaxID=3127014 RepID=A0A934NGF9_9BACT|nr:GNAT family N-acetyltransferase [Candidatus Dormibacteraeota bacterium]
MAGPIVRPAEQRDADGIGRVWVDAWRVGYRGLVPDAVLDSISLDHRQQQWRARLGGGDPGARTSVSVIGGEVVGYCRLALPSRDADAGAGATTAEVASIYVTTARRRTGIGHALLSTALDAMRADGWRRATLWVFVDNEAARRFYSRYGFAADGGREHDHGTGLDELRLRLALTGSPPRSPV